MYGKASREKDPKASADLFTQDAKYYETPFDDPMISKDAIYQYWSAGTQNLKDKEPSYEVFAVEGNRGLARWQAKFVSVKSIKRVALDCVFQVEFDENEKCSVFREWWHRQAIDTSSNDTYGRSNKRLLLDNGRL